MDKEQTEKTAERSKIKIEILEAGGVEILIVEDTKFVKGYCAESDEECPF